MKFYTEGGAIGDSGVFYLGHWITTHFGWPFRIQAIADIGIDAEFEICEDDNRSTSIIVKAQIKSTKTAIKKDFSTYVSKEHLTYWINMPLPVVLIKVDLATPCILYKIVSNYDDVYPTGNGYRIDFSYDNDQLRPSEKGKIRLFFRSIELENLYDMLNKINVLMNRINPEGVNDQDTFNYQMSLLDECKSYLQRVESLKISYPWKFGGRINQLLTDYQKNIHIFTFNINRRLSETGY